MRRCESARVRWSGAMVRCEGAMVRSDHCTSPRRTGPSHRRPVAPSHHVAQKSIVTLNRTKRPSLPGPPCAVKKLGLTEDEEFAPAP